MAHSGQSLYQRSVFINCPFDGEYVPIFRAIIFTVFACGFEPRSTLEHEDASQVRIEKIYRLIGRLTPFEFFGRTYLSVRELKEFQRIERLPGRPWGKKIVASTNPGKA
jgi:hypothetical protein